MSYGSELDTVMSRKLTVSKQLGSLYQCPCQLGCLPLYVGPVMNCWYLHSMSCNTFQSGEWHLKDSWLLGVCSASGSWVQTKHAPISVCNCFTYFICYIFRFKILHLQNIIFFEFLCVHVAFLSLNGLCKVFWITFVFKQIAHLSLKKTASVRSK